MTLSKALRGVAVAACLGASLLAVVASGASASGGIKLCVPSKENKPLKTPKAGNVCAAGATLMELGAEGKEGPAGKEGKEGPAPKAKTARPDKKAKPARKAKKAKPACHGFRKLNRHFWPKSFPASSM